jgi:hypothetical protein
MTRYSFAQLEGLWIQAGGDKLTAPMAAGIAMAESGGDSTAHSPTNDWGLWQINNGGSAMLDPMANAKRAVSMSNNGKNWRPWCTAYSDAACGTKGGTYSLANSPAGRALHNAGGAIPPAFGGVPSVQAVGANVPASATSVASYNPNTCAWGIQLPSFSSPKSVPIPIPAIPNPANPGAPIIPGPNGVPIPNVTVGGQGFCILSKTQARGAIGAWMVIFGQSTIIVGLILLTAYGLAKTGAIQKAAKLPGIGKAASTIKSKS